jgi:hypothetical protein
MPTKRLRQADDGPSSEGQDRPHKSQRQDMEADPPSLASLLDFSTLTSHSDIDIRFGQLADALLCGHLLLLKHDGHEYSFNILELEFYLQKSGCHDDPFTHGADEQRYSGRWWDFHAPIYTRTNNARAQVFSSCPNQFINFE